MTNRKALYPAALMVLAFWAMSFVIIRTGNGAKVHWNYNNPYYLINKDGPSKTISRTCVADSFQTIQDAFNVWNNIPDTTIEVLYGGTTSIRDFCGMDESRRGCDANNIVEFARSSIFPAHALAVTVNYYSTADGAILGSDVVFNDTIAWSDDPLDHPNPACTGANFYSLAGVASHEIGHFYGLDHSFVGFVGDAFVPEISALMFPYYFGNSNWLDMTVPKQDDIAGLFDLYPGSPPPAWGKITGKVSSDGNGIFGVHVVAIRKSDKVPETGILTERSGNYQISGLPPGDYYVFAETPDLGGESYTSTISDYYAQAKRVPYVQLFNSIHIYSYPELDQGSSVFNRATPVTVSAYQEASGINFSYQNPNPGGGGGSECGGCALKPGPVGENSWFDLPSIFLLLVFAGYGLMRIRRKRQPHLSPGQDYRSSAQ